MTEKLPAIQFAKIGDIKPNPENPRIIKDDKFHKLVKSILEFPQMLSIRPIVVNSEMMVLGGNMRLKACKEAGLKEVPYIKVSDLSEAQQKEFIIKDNVGFGEWDWEVLQNGWDMEQLEAFGLDIPVIHTDNLDYSILDDDSANSEADGIKRGVKKALVIDFELEHYDEAFKLSQSLRGKGIYIGSLLLEVMREANK